MFKHDREIIKLFEYNYLLHTNEVYFLSLKWKKSKITFIFKPINKFLPTLSSIDNKLSLGFIDHDIFFKATNDLPNTNIKLSENYLKSLNFEIQDYVHKWDIFCYSASSLALKMFLYNFNHFNVKVSLSVEEDKVFRQAYLGERCEVFGNPLNSEFIFHFDFYSMYGQVMLENFPFGNYQKILNPTNVDKPGFYFITAKSYELKIPVLPHKRLADGKEEILYANGTFKGLY